MAHLRRHPGSKFWFLRFRDSTGLWREKSLKLLIADEKDTREALRREAEQSRLEGFTASPDRSEQFDQWVLPFLRDHYQNPRSRRRYEGAWERIREWLRGQHLLHPRELRYAHSIAFMEWRRAQVSHNSALLEAKFFSFILREAVRRGYAEGNSWAALGVARRAARVKQELTDEMIQRCRAAVAGLPWARVIFEVMLFTGCRFSEVGEIGAEDIDKQRGIITITDAKRPDGDPRKQFTVPLHPGLGPVLRELRAGIGGASREKNFRFNRFLKAAAGVTSHSLRVTFVTRCHRAGLSEREAMRLVNHSSKLVHAIYSRLGADDLRDAQARVSLPMPVSSGAAAPIGSSSSGPRTGTRSGAKRKSAGS